MTVGYTFLLYGEGVIYDWIPTLPGRKLILDSEFRTDMIPGEVVEWDGKGAFPTCGENASVVVPVPSAQAFAQVVSAIASNKLPIKSVVQTSITMAQQNQMDEQYSGAPSKQQDWGNLLKDFWPHMKKLLQTAKDGNKSVECVVITAGSKEIVSGEAMKIRPFIEGQLSQRMNYLVDVIGYLSRRKVGQKRLAQMQIETLAVENAPDVLARYNYPVLDKYNGIVSDPNITKLIADMKGN